MTAEVPHWSEKNCARVPFSSTTKRWLYGNLSNATSAWASKAGGGYHCLQRPKRHVRVLVNRRASLFKINKNLESNLLIAKFQNRFISETRCLSFAKIYDAQ